MQSLPLTIETQLTIASKEFLSSHPELHHYTTFAGLEGIVRSNTIWATHFSGLNDATEVILFREPLVRALTESFSEIIRRQQNANAYVRQAIQVNGGIAEFAERVSKDVVEGLYKVTFDSNASFSFAEPFITSFCSHVADQPYEKEQGLLSQWRGYGGDGGFCIVFDTVKLSELLAREFDSHYLLHLNISPVHYALGTASIKEMFPKVIDVCNYFIAGIFEGRASPPIDDGFAPFVAAATLFKHHAFSEEREVRIVAIPGSDEVQKKVQAEYPAEFKASPLKCIRERGSSSGKRRYIALFDTLDVRLPIKRVIVGPSRHQRENYERVAALLNDSVSVAVSETPFIG
jgi:hypothetical protein